MDTGVFLTQQASKGVQGAAGPASSALSGGKGVFAAIPGLNFLDLILANIVDSNNADGSKSDATQKDVLLFAHQRAKNIADQAEIALVPVTGADESAEIATLSDLQDMITAITASEEDIVISADSAEIVADGTDLTETTDAVWEHKKEKFVDFLQNLLLGIPQESRPTVFSLPPGLLRNAIGKLETGAQNDTPPDLVATGLTPQDLTDLIKKLSDGNADAEAYVIGIVKFLPAQAKREAIFVPRAVIVSSGLAAQQQAKSAANNALAGDTQQAGEGAQAAEGSDDAPVKAALDPLLSSGDDNAEAASRRARGFEDILRILEQAQQKGTPENIGKQYVSNAEKGAQDNGAKPGLSSFTPPPSFPPGDLPAQAAWDSIFPDGFDFSLDHMQQGRGLSMNSPTMMASLINNVQQATQSHPATQMVAVTIAKAASNGESKSFTVKLEPPELGRVEVRMHFEKNSVKAHLVVEKPETYMMLQRDAHVLERIIHDLGMDGGGNSLSFELSQDGSQFGGDANQGGSNDSGGGSANAADGEEEIIETTMNWYVDPDSGLTRYDLLV